MIGKNKMKNWKAAVNVWAKNNRDKNKKDTLEDFEKSFNVERGKHD